MTPLRLLLRNHLRFVLIPTVVLGVALATPSTAPTLAPAAHATSAAPARLTPAQDATPETARVAERAAARAGCRSTSRSFRPTSAAISGITSSAKVLALGRDRYGVPSTPPLTSSGRWQLAWDRDAGIRPGGRFGVVRLNAHTYPRSGAYGSALGNRLLQRLHRGDRIVLFGPGGQRVCYRVTKRFRVRAGGNFASYYSSTGPSRLGILVCSGKRRGPGNWSHRTIWFATPVG